MTIEQMRYFIAVAAYESFSEAAAKCSISQSSISKHIAVIEQEVGAQLLDRSRRKVALTSTGVIFLGYAQKLVNSYEKMQRDMRACVQNAGQSLTISMHCLSMHYDTLPSIIAFKGKYPQLNLQTKHVPNWNIWDMLESGECNFGILYDDGIDLSKYQVLNLVEDRLAFVVPAAHPLACRSRISILDLKGMPMAFSCKQTQMLRIATQACYRFGFEPEIAFQDHFPEPLLSLLSINQVGMLYMDHALRYYNLNGLKIIPLEEKIEIPLVLVRQSKNAMTPTEQIFCNFMREYSRNASKAEEVV